MNDLLSNPILQGGLAPFFVALAAGLLLGRHRLAGVAVVLAFAATVGLAMGWSIQPLVGSRKLSFAGLAAGCAVIVIAAGGLRRVFPVRLGLAALAAVACLWVCSGLLRQMEAWTAVVAASGCVLFLAALCDAAQAQDDNIAPCAAAVALGLGSGGLALTGASAVLSLLGISVAAGAGALLLLQVLVKQWDGGWTLALPSALVAGLVVALSVAGGGVAWYAALPLLAIPWAARLAFHPGRPAWMSAATALCAALVPSAIAVGLAWATAAFKAH